MCTVTPAPALVVVNVFPLIPQIALFLRSGYLPGALARYGIFGAALFVPASIVMFVYPAYIDVLKLFGLPNLLAEVVTAFWLLFKGLQPRATAAARA
jgi:hypothetical protein